MSSNRSIKERAKKKVKYNYWHSIIISFLFVIIVSGGYKYNSFISDSFSNIGNNVISKNNLYIYNNIVNSAKKVIDISKSIIQKEEDIQIHVDVKKAARMFEEKNILKV